MLYDIHRGFAGGFTGGFYGFHAGERPEYKSHWSQHAVSRDCRHAMPAVSSDSKLQVTLPAHVLVLLVAEPIP